MDDTTNTRDKLTWLTIATLVIFAGGFVLALIVTDQPAPSAAITIRRTLAALILAPILLGGAAALIKPWWKRRQKRQKLEEALLQAEVYERLQGGMSQPASRRRSPALPRGEHGSINIVLPGGRDYPRIERGGWYGE